jgi:predicted N-formylglutamate amidohydrolase
MRDVEIGVLHDTDSRLADAMLDCAQAQTQNNVQRNEPYGPEHGVTHTLKEHAITQGHPNVMLEIRNDLIATPEQQKNMARMIAQWIAQACAQMTLSGDVQCQA